ncbi:MAG: peptidase M23 [Parcubacteria group bacterium Gr01-1014_66]|nr:MAG: peptidase M23 [Parcubacteria group bacterium Gr01-1014_66]
MYLNHELGIMNYGEKKKNPLLHNSCFIIHTSFVLGTLIFFSNVLLHEAYGATEIELRARMEAQQKEIQQLEEEIAAYQKTLQETTAQSKTLQQEVTRIETQVKKLNSDMRLTQKRIIATELQIEDFDGNIIKNESKMEVQRRALAETLQAVYQTDGNSLMEVFLQHEHLSDFFGSLEDIQHLEQSIHDDLASLRELKTVLQDERAARTQQKDSLSKLNRELENRRAIEEDAKQSKKILLTVTKNEEARYQQLLREREAKREAMLAETQRIEDQLRQLINPSVLPESHQGVLGWPLKGNVVLTQNFGNTPYSQILYNGKPHNGIDIRAPIGTPIYAAESGEVWETGNTDAFPGCLSYGKWVLIKHPNNLSTLYAHLSQIGSIRGSSVSRGDLIGYTGDTGYATGPHLHLTVYDSSTVQFRSSKIPGSNCQYLPYGGYLNPLAYL